MGTDAVDVCDTLYELLKQAGVKFKRGYQEHDGYDDLEEALNEVRIIKKSTEKEREKWWKERSSNIAEGQHNEYFMVAACRCNALEFKGGEWGEDAETVDLTVGEILNDEIAWFDAEKDWVVFGVTDDLKQVEQLFKGK